MYSLVNSQCEIAKSLVALISLAITYAVRFEFLILLMTAHEDGIESGILSSKQKKNHAQHNKQNHVIGNRIIKEMRHFLSRRVASITLLGVYG
jgi:hypothetical protein